MQNVNAQTGFNEIINEAYDRVLGGESDVSVMRLITLWPSNYYPSWAHSENLDDVRRIRKVGKWRTKWIVFFIGILPQVGAYENIIFPCGLSKFDDWILLSINFYLCPNVGVNIYMEVWTFISEISYQFIVENININLLYWNSDYIYCLMKVHDVEVTDMNSKNPNIKYYISIRVFEIRWLGTIVQSMTMHDQIGI